MYSTRESYPRSMKHKISRQIFENIQIPNWIKTLLVGAERFYADGWTNGETRWR